MRIFLAPVFLEYRPQNSKNCEVIVEVSLSHQVVLPNDICAGNYPAFPLLLMRTPIGRGEQTGGRRNWPESLYWSTSGERNYTDQNTHYVGLLGHHLDTSKIIIRFQAPSYVISCLGL
jgi:hypothetical protein